MKQYDEIYVKCAPSIMDGGFTLCKDTMAGLVPVSAVEPIKNVIVLEMPGQSRFLIGLTQEDLVHLQAGGRVKVNPKDVGFVDLPIEIFIGTTDEELLQEYKDKPNHICKIVKSHEE